MSKFFLLSVILLSIVEFSLLAEDNETGNFIPVFKHRIANEIDYISWNTDKPGKSRTIVYSSIQAKSDKSSDILIEYVELDPVSEDITSITLYSGSLKYKILSARIISGCSGSDLAVFQLQLPAIRSEVFLCFYNLDTILKSPLKDPVAQALYKIPLSVSTGKTGWDFIYSPEWENYLYINQSAVNSRFVRITASIISPDFSSTTEYILEEMQGSIMYPGITQGENNTFVYWKEKRASEASRIVINTLTFNRDENSLAIEHKLQIDSGYFLMSPDYVREYSTTGDRYAENITEKIPACVSGGVLYLAYRHVDVLGVMSQPKTQLHLISYNLNNGDIKNSQISSFHFGVFPVPISVNMKPQGLDILNILIDGSGWFRSGVYRTIIPDKTQPDVFINTPVSLTSRCLSSPVLFRTDSRTEYYAWLQQDPVTESNQIAFYINRTGTWQQRLLEKSGLILRGSKSETITTFISIVPISIIFSLYKSTIINIPPLVLLAIYINLLFRFFPEFIRQYKKILFPILVIFQIFLTFAWSSILPSSLSIINGPLINILLSVIVSLTVSAILFLHRFRDKLPGPRDFIVLIWLSVSIIIIFDTYPSTLESVKDYNVINWENMI